jgi:hypothetical protein
MKGLKHVYMDAATGGEGGGAATGSTPAAGAPADGAAAVADSSAATGAAGASGAGGAGAAGGAGSTSGEGAGNALQDGAGKVSIPEKYQVKKEDGTLDIEASSLKLAEAYGHLEKRMGSGDVPPKTADEYTFEVPEAMKDAVNLDTDPMFAEFKKQAHAKRLTQDQFDFVMGQYMERAPQLVGGAKALSAEDCVADLKAEWKTDEQYKAEVGKAYKAAVGYAGDDADYIIKTYGNDPKVIRMLNRIGAEMGEDQPAPHGRPDTGQSIDSMMASEAYNNPKHPDHASVSKAVAAHFAVQAKEAEKSGAAPLM